MQKVIAYKDPAEDGRSQALRGGGAPLFLCGRFRFFVWRVRQAPWTMVRTETFRLSGSRHPAAGGKELPTEADC
jgi:hypothetical protein